MLTLRSLDVRIPAEMEKEILKIIEQEKLDKDAVVKNLLEIGVIEWWKQSALNFLCQGKVTFAKAAEMAGLSLWEFGDLVKQRNVKWARFEPEDLEKVQTEK